MLGLSSETRLVEGKKRTKRNEGNNPRLLYGLSEKRSDNVMRVLGLVNKKSFINRKKARHCYLFIKPLLTKFQNPNASKYSLTSVKNAKVLRSISMAQTQVIYWLVSAFH